MLDFTGSSEKTKENVCLQRDSNPQPLASQTGALCIVHIKVYDRAIKSLSVSRPIHPVGLSQIGKRRGFTLKICTRMATLMFCVGRSSTDNRTTFCESGEHRSMIGRPVTDTNRTALIGFQEGFDQMNNTSVWPRFAKTFMAISAQCYSEIVNKRRLLILVRNKTKLHFFKDTTKSVSDFLN